VWLAIAPKGSSLAQRGGPQLGLRCRKSSRGFLKCGFAADSLPFFGVVVVQARQPAGHTAGRDSAWHLGFRGRGALRIGGDGLPSPPRPCPWATAGGFRLALVCLRSRASPGLGLSLPSLSPPAL